MVKSEIISHQDGIVHLGISGKVDEHFDARQLLEAAQRAKRVVLKLDGVRSITSLGVRALETFMKALHGREVVLEDISAAMANQLSMIPNLLQGARVTSARLPFICPACGTERLHAIPYEREAAATHAPACPSCAAKMEFDGFAEEYLPH
jgi:anti-anti-sigma regulatory factor